jgi:hypothetical protein
MSLLMKKIRNGLLCCCCFFGATATFAEVTTEFEGTYFCTADAVGGVRYNEVAGDWVGYEFGAGSRYILNIRNNSEILDEFNGEMRMTYFIEFLEHGAGSNILANSCSTKSNQLRSINPLASFISDSGYFSCNLTGGDLTVDLGTLRFLKSYTWGYVDGVDDNRNTPFIMVGTCSRVN